MNTLKHLAGFSCIVADSSIIDDIKPFLPLHGVTTNPTLVRKALEQHAYSNMVQEAVHIAKKEANENTFVETASDALLALIGAQLHRTLQVQVSLEVDAKLAFDAKGTIARAERINAFCRRFAMPEGSFLIKIAATKEGLEAVRILQNQGIDCNVTLVFSFAQALAAAQVGAYLISPFVGRVSDWHARNNSINSGECAGIRLVRDIHSIFGQSGIKTKVMAASFRTTSQIVQLCGVDLLTIAPPLLRALSEEHFQPRPYYENVDARAINQRVADILQSLDPKSEQLNSLLQGDTMVNELLHDGVTRFCDDQREFDAMLKTQY